LFKRVSLSTFIIHLVLAAAAFICVAPIINIIAISFSESSIAITGEVYFMPKRFTLASYTKLMAEGAFVRSFMISVFRVIAAVIISMPVMIMMAYALSKSKGVFRERNIVMWIAVITMLFNGGLIPTYIVIKSYGLIDSFWVLVFPLIMNVYNMIIMMNFFRGIPVELEEAAIIDGAGVVRTLVSVYLPVSLPSLATITLFTVVMHWNDFFWGLIYMNKQENYPLQTYIRSLTMKIDFTAMLDPRLLAEYLKVSNLTFNASKIVVSMIPVLIVYPFLQKYFVSGLVMGSVKE
jgi:putative aldouronate transport system permease protein